MISSIALHSCMRSVDNRGKEVFWNTRVLARFRLFWFPDSVHLKGTQLLTSYMPGCVLPSNGGGFDRFGEYVEPLSEISSK